MQRISPVTRLKILINPQKYQRITTTVSKPYRVVRLKDLSNSKFPRIYANIHGKARLHRRREPSSPVTKFSEFHRWNWVEEISDKETRQRSQTLLYHSTAPDRDKEKKPPLSACCSARFTFRPFLLLLSKNSTAFCPKEATDETRFPSYSRKVGRKAETREILRESLSQPPPLLDGRNVFFQGHAESSGSVSSTFILRLGYLLRGMEHRGFGYSTRCPCGRLETGGWGLNSVSVFFFGGRNGRDRRWSGDAMMKIIFNEYELFDLAGCDK